MSRRQLLSLPIHDRHRQRPYDIPRLSPVALRTIFLQTVRDARHEVVPPSIGTPFPGAAIARMILRSPGRVSYSFYCELGKNQKGPRRHRSRIREECHLYSCAMVMSTLFYGFRIPMLEAAISVTMRIAAEGDTVYYNSGRTQGV